MRERDTSHLDIWFDEDHIEVGTSSMGRGQTWWRQSRCFTYEYPLAGSLLCHSCRCAKGGGAGLPYKLDADQPRTVGGLCKWDLCSGKTKDTGDRVSILQFSKAKASPWQIEAALNFIKRARTLRHPSLLPFVDAGHNDKIVYLVTKEVTPLRVFLDHSGRTALDDPKLPIEVLPWGVFCLSRAVSFINNDCNLLHGSVIIDNIYVSKAGDWYLGGFDTVVEFTASSGVEALRRIDSYGHSMSKAPERRHARWAEIADGPAWAIDAWNLGDALASVAKCRLLEGNQLSRTLLNIANKLMMDVPSRRMNSSQVLVQPPLVHDFVVRINLFFENVALKDLAEQIQFYEELSGKITSIPNLVTENTLLPAVMRLLSQGELHSQGPQYIRALIHLAAEAMQMVKPAVAKLNLSPILERLFSNPDRMLRICLLEYLEQFLKLVEDGPLNKSIFPAVAVGFNDSVPMLRELTVKSMLHLAPRLDSKNLNDALLKHLARRLMDTEPAIRTNTTVCLGKIAPYLSEKAREKSLVPAFSRGMRDPFPHARLAAIQATAACEDFFEAHTICTKILPGLCCLLLDTSPPVRSEAATAVHSMLGVVEVAREAMDREMTEDHASAAPEGSADSSRAVASWSKWMSGLKPQSESHSITGLEKSPSNVKPSSTVGGLLGDGSAPTEESRIATGKQPVVSSSDQRPGGGVPPPTVRFVDEMGTVDDGWGTDNWDLDFSPTETLNKSNVSRIATLNVSATNDKATKEVLISPMKFDNVTERETNSGKVVSRSGAQVGAHISSAGQSRRRAEKRTTKLPTAEKADKGWDDWDDF